MCNEIRSHLVSSQLWGLMNRACGMTRAIYHWDRLVWLICHRRFGVDLSVMASASWIRELEFFSNWSSESSLEEVALPDGRIQLFRAP